MRFVGSVPVTNGGTTADPLAAPASVPDANLVSGAFNDGPAAAAPTGRMLLGFDAPGGSGTTTVELWALDEATSGLALASRKYYRVATGLVLTHRILIEVKATVPATGPIYVRQTAGTTAGVVNVAVQASAA